MDKPSVFFLNAGGHCAGSVEVAHHEAGHIVMGFLKRKSPTRVTIIPGEGFSGKCVLKLGKLTTDQQIKNAVQIVMAGQIAQVLYCNKQDSVALEKAGSKGYVTLPIQYHHDLDDDGQVIPNSDTHIATDLIDQVCATEVARGHYFQYVYEQTAAELAIEHNWTRVERVATALVEKGTLVSKELISLCQLPIPAHAARRSERDMAWTN